MDPAAPEQTDQKDEPPEHQLCRHGTPDTHKAVGTGEKKNGHHPYAPHAAKVQEEGTTAVSGAPERAR